MNKQGGGGIGGAGRRLGEGALEGVLGRQCLLEVWSLGKSWE